MEQDIDTFMKSANSHIHKLEQERDRLEDDYWSALAELELAQENGFKIKSDLLKEPIPVKEGVWDLLIANYFHSASFGMLFIKFNKHVASDPFDGDNIDRFAWSQCEIVK